MSVPKKDYLLLLLDALHKYTSDDEELSQTKIQRIIEEKYAVHVDRKTIRRNIDFLNAFFYEYDIKFQKEGLSKILYYDEGKKVDKEKFDRTKYYNISYRHMFQEAELRLIIDMVASLDYISPERRHDLINRLKNLQSHRFKHKYTELRKNEKSLYTRSQFLIILDRINTAIENQKQISFYLGDEKANIIKYVVSPYKTSFYEGFYYLIGKIESRKEGYNTTDVSENEYTYFRIDKVKGLKITDRPTTKTKYFLNNINRLSLKSTSLMFSFDLSIVRFKCAKSFIDTVRDYFGDEYSIVEDQEETHTIQVRVSIEEIKKWILKYMEYVEVIEPLNLREEIISILGKSLEKYCN